MTDDQQSPTNLDDAELLGKFNRLLNRYQHHGQLIQTVSAPEPASTVLRRPHRTTAIESEQIPVLTEVVVLHPSVIQPQPTRLTPVRQLLDAALKDAGIDMTIADRTALAHALKIRLLNQAN